MARVTVEDCLEKLENRFLLVHLVAERAKQLKKGDKPFVFGENKEIVTALREIAEGKITFKRKPRVFEEQKLPNA